MPSIDPTAPPMRVFKLALRIRVSKKIIAKASTPLWLPKESPCHKWLEVIACTHERHDEDDTNQSNIESHMTSVRLTYRLSRSCYTTLRIVKLVVKDQFAVRSLRGRPG